MKSFFISLRYGFILSLFSFTVVHAQTVIHEFIYEDAPFPSAHASTIVETPDGMVAAWFGGTHEKHDDVGIWVSRKFDGRWTPPEEVVNGIQHEDKRYPCWNPVLHYDDKLYLFYKVGPNPRDWWGEVMSSEDNGLSWNMPRRLPEDILGPVKNKAITLEDGTWLCPSSTEHDGWTIHMEITKDKGKTWKRVGPLQSESKIDAIQPTALILENGDIKILCRSKKSGLVASTSNDGGLSWTPLKRTSLPNPNSGVDGVTTRSGTHYLVYNPTSTPEGDWGGERYPLLLASSKNGKDWTDVVTLESEEGEYSYPAIIEAEDGSLHITYTWKREKVKHVVVHF